MAKVRNLKNAPIMEAIIDFRVQLSAGTTVSQLKDLHSRIKTEYPNVVEHRRWKGTFNIKQGNIQPPQTEDLGVSGYIFKSVDSKQIVQFRLDGFTFSRLKPYSEWDTVKAEANKLWDIYSSAGVEKVTRVATRYINLVDIPLPVPQLEDYLTGLPSAPTLSLGLSSFLNRIQVREATQEFDAIITQVLQPPSNPAVVSILLDIDAYKQASFDSPFDKAWETLENLRAFKNELFFNLITEKAVKLYE